MSETKNTLILDIVMQWVAVSERLPENKWHDFSDWVMAADDAGYVFKTRYDYQYNQWMDKANVPENKVTHWMELPKPPYA